MSTRLRECAARRHYRSEAHRFLQRKLLDLRAQYRLVRATADQRRGDGNLAPMQYEAKATGYELVKSAAEKRVQEMEREFMAAKAALAA